VPEPFDPYLQWLDIQTDRRPPDHYTLLGLEPLESDPQVIAHAADVRMARIRKIRPGVHVGDWGRLLDQLQAVKVCLLEVASKAAYDASLSKEEPARGVGAKVSGPADRSEATPVLATPPDPTGPPPQAAAPRVQAPAPLVAGSNPALEPARPAWPPSAPTPT